MSPSIEPKQGAQWQSATPETADKKEKGKENPATSFDDPSTNSDNDAGSPPSATSATPAPSTDVSAGVWQAIYSSQHNAYYFYNSSTNETTWINPLQPSPSDPSSTDPKCTEPDGSAEINPYDSNSLEARAIAAGIDPSLAHLDPSFLTGPSSMAPTGTFAAKFNARTGTFTAANARAPSHLSEYDRMKRMSEFYFDVGAWEQEVEHRDAEEKEAGGKKRKRPTKKDLDRFKEQKKLKKIAKTAWLRT
ncbi:hypothetical protein PAXRUDRAFT_834506 [Paxillus rubicundulus Ve08.2h10]|uniref:WW domain-containing protein n=1 Tax=Paxillus rubicundulus Ve08.2h10 TaxID=930991 RepID=A0A0D0CT76_9AGAM|nr:hypothetical protein PAXRUDRAFT_834506 [Paxillus rubicundulus Ve08.2h10]